MTDFSFNLLQNLYPKRDSYGFALRPQYAQRYREYSFIYKEEEDERSDKWRSFLEQIAISSQPSSSENKHKDTLKAEGTEVEEETGAGSVSEGNDSGGRKPAADNEIIEETVPDRVSKGGDSSGWESSEGTEIKEDTSPGRVGVGDDSSGRKSVSNSSTGNNSEKELQHSAERKTCKVQRWDEIRPSLTAIEEIMSSRVKRGKKMKGEQINGNNSHLPTIEESEPIEGVSKEDIQEQVCTNETVDDSINGSRAENAFVDQDSPELFSPWKELESLVQGGVPKDLRGEVWQAFVGVKARRVESYYEDLLAQETNSGETKEQDVPSGALGKWRKQIEKVISCMRLGLYFDL